jgi:hypothetical protein
MVVRDAVVDYPTAKAVFPGPDLLTFDKLERQIIPAAQAGERHYLPEAAKSATAVDNEPQNCSFGLGKWPDFRICHRRIHLTIALRPYTENISSSGMWGQLPQGSDTHANYGGYLNDIERMGTDREKGRADRSDELPQHADAHTSRKHGSQGEKT